MDMSTSIANRSLWPPDPFCGCAPTTRVLLTSVFGRLYAITSWRAFREGDREAEDQVQSCALGHESSPAPVERHLPGPLLLWSGRRERKRLADGVVYEPRMMV